jgi:uncharacterized protein (TIGR02145 family)
MMKRLAIKMILIVGLFLITSCEKKESGLPIDGDGNEYDTIAIGSQVWLAENLKTTKYNNGITIPLVTDNSQWASMSSAAFCWYNNQPEKFKTPYGALYNGWAANVGYICPVGYHVSTKDDWDTLISFLGGEDVAGGKLKEIGNNHWQNNSFATNETGFSAIGAGTRDHTNGNFNAFMSTGCWWVTNSGFNYAEITAIFSNVHLGGLTSKAGFSIRCVKNK